MFQNPTFSIMSSIVVPWLLAGILVPISMIIASDLHNNHPHHRENSMFYDHDPTTINGFDLKRIRPESSKSAVVAAASPPTPTTSANRFAPFGGTTVASRPIHMIGQYQQTISSSPAPPPPPSQLQLIPIEFPKSINDKIKFVSQNSGVVGGGVGGGRQSHDDDDSDPQFIQKIIPKLTTALFNSRPFSLADHEDSVVQYRSPNAVMMMDDGRPRQAATIAALPSAKHPAAIQHSGLRSQATTKYPSSLVNVGGAQIQMLTNLNQAKPARTMMAGTSGARPRQMYVNNINHNHKSPSSSPRETYMTLSFEQDSDPRISGSESPMQAPHHIGSGFYPRQPQQPTMKTIQSLGHKTTHYVSGRLKSPVDRPGPPSNSKVSAYHQQLFNSSPSRPTGTSKHSTQLSLSQSDPNPQQPHSAGFDYKTTTFGAIRTPSHPVSTHPMMHPSKSMDTPTMTLSFQDDPESKWNNNHNNQNNMESNGQQQQSFDWHKSLLGYSKEFGFEMPDPGQTNHYDGHDGGKQRYSSSPSILRTVTMNDDAAASAGPPHGTGVFDDFDDEATMGEGPNFKTAGMEPGSKLSYFRNDDTMKSLFQDDADDGPNFRSNSNSNNFFQEKPIQDVDVDHHPTSTSFGNKSPPDHQLQDLLRKLTEKSSL